MHRPSTCGSWLDHTTVHHWYSYQHLNPQSSHFANNDALDHDRPGPNQSKHRPCPANVYVEKTSRPLIPITKHVVNVLVVLFHELLDEPLVLLTGLTGDLLSVQS